MKTFVVSTKQSGSSLIEVMVALLIFAIGMLGVASLQGVGIRFGEQSNSYTQAAVQVADITARMKANRAGVEAGYYDDTIQAVADLSKNCFTAQCSTQELAQFDLAHWNTRNSQLLPSGTGVITATSTAAGETQFKVDVIWKRQTSAEDTADGGGHCAANENQDTASNELAYCVTVEIARL
ncbi:MAG: type IV pilus modification protein PilV [Gammaproteobacteria bacterium]|nr:type IV pilus modification protein PilV [Gammaproteobacteria bacterium]